MALAAPLLVASERRHARILQLPVCWHFFSLDAPTVAVLWAWSFCRAAHARCSPGGLAILGIGTWLIYVADRLLDSRPGAAHHQLRARHFFHRRHRRAFLTAAAVASSLLLWLIVARMSPAARREDTLLFAASMLYFAVIHRPAVCTLPWLRREFAVGLIFACATAVPAWSHTVADRKNLILPVLAFAALCCLNCLAIDEWEQTASPLAAPPRRLPISLLAIFTAAAAGALTLDALLHDSQEAGLSLSMLASALLLFALDRLHRQKREQDSPVSALVLRISADAALLTPLLFVLPWHA